MYIYEAILEENEESLGVFSTKKDAINRIQARVALGLMIYGGEYERESVTLYRRSYGFLTKRVRVYRNVVEMINGIPTKIEEGFYKV